MPDKQPPSDAKQLSDAQFTGLVVKYTDKITTDEELIQLEVEVRRCERRRELFIQVCRQGWSIQVALSSPPLLSEGEVLARIGNHQVGGQDQQTANWGPSRGYALFKSLDKRVRVFAAAACFGICGLLALYFISNSSMNGSGNKFPETIRYSYGIDATWAGEPVKLSDKMKPGAYELTGGMALILFPSGAEVLVQAPTSFEIVSDNEIRLTSGTVTARCETPASKGFAVTTADWKVVDLGTEFAVQVTEDRAEVGVYEGEVVISGPAESQLRVGDAVSLYDQQITRLPDGLTDPAVARIDVFLARLDAGNGSANSRWLRAGYDYTDNDSLIAWIDVSREGDFSWISDRATSWSHAAKLEEASKHNFDSDRYDRMAAVRVDDTDDAIGLEFNKSYQSMTLSAWVYFDPEADAEKRHRGILMSEEWKRIGSVHWQRRGAGVRVEVYSAQTTKTKKVLRFMASSDQLAQGGWHHLVTVIDGQAQQVSHFINGDLVSREKTSIPIPALRLGKATIGAWHADNEGTQGRALNGAIDDMMIWRRALDPSEIKQLYQQSAP